MGRWGYVGGRGLATREALRDQEVAKFTVMEATGLSALA